MRVKTIVTDSKCLFSSEVRCRISVLGGIVVHSGRHLITGGDKVRDRMGVSVTTGTKPVLTGSIVLVSKVTP